MQHLPKISLIATTYNWPDALRLCIESIGRQTLVPFEVIIADDGSTDDTRTLIERMRKDFPCPIVHAWQEDLGFRAAEVRNNALRLCKGDYVVFIDGDIIMHPHFVEDHAKMAQPGYYVIGSRAKFNEKATARMLAGGAVQAHWYSPGISRRMNALYLPWLGPLTVGYRKSKPLYNGRRLFCHWGLVSNAYAYTKKTVDTKSIDCPKEFFLKVSEMRLELTRSNDHYPLKVARLPIPPSGQILQGRLRREVSLSEKRDSNPRPRPWQGRALPTELFSQNTIAFSDPLQRISMF